jgi:hypothetical protein
MALNSIRGMLAGFFTSLDHLLMTLAAGEDLRVRQVIARAVTQACPEHGSTLETRRGERPGVAANSRVE